MATTTPLQAQVGWRDFLELTKPRVTALIVFTAAVGMLLATPGQIPLDIFVFGLTGIALASGSAAAINHVADDRIDALMGRTRNRPLPTGAVRRRDALVFALTIGVISMLMLTFLVNALTAALTFASLIGYAVIYTMYLKRATPQNIVIGGAAGAAPPVLGWTAVTGTIDPHALLLFLIIFAWTPPHFWALAIYKRNEYAKTGVPMLPVTHGVDYTRWQILAYTILMVLSTLLPYVTFMCGEIYLCGAMALNAVFMWHAVRILVDHRDILAFRMFKYSITYLMALFLVIFVDRYAPLMRGLLG
jgi:protoheme IX farnesyltransferase